MSQSSFLDFILDAYDDENLTQNFLATETQDDLEAFFKKQGVIVDDTELKKIWEIKTKLPPVPPWGRGPSPRY